MLVMPNDPTPFRVMGIDPGTTTLGISVIEWGFVERSFLVQTAFTVKVLDTAPAWQSTAEYHGNRYARLRQLHAQVGMALRDYQPHAVCCEAPFKGRFVQSFAALTECVSVIRTAVYEHNPHLPMEMVDPNTAKLAAGAQLKRGGDQKQIVVDALAQRRDIRWGVDMASLDEHSIDSVAVGLHYLQSIL